MHLHKLSHPNKGHFHLTPVFTKNDLAIAQFPSFILDMSLGIVFSSYNFVIGDFVWGQYLEPGLISQQYAKSSVSQIKFSSVNSMQELILIWFNTQITKFIVFLELLQYIRASL